MGERPKLAFIEILNLIGLNTKSSNEIKQDLSVSESLNTDLFRVYGAVSKTFGSSRVLNAVYTESGAPKKISWIGNWKNTALNGQTDRQVLCAAGTKLHKVFSGALTPLTGSGFSITEDWIEGLYHIAEKANDLLFITNKDPDLIGHGNTLVKYDGLDITRWGLLAPGTEPNVTKLVDSVGSINGTWIVTGGTAVADSVTTQDGYAVSVTKTTTATTLAYIEQAFTIGLSATNAHQSAVKLFVFIPLGELTKLSQTQALNIVLGSDTQVSVGVTIPDFTTNKYSWIIPIGELFEGWNQIDLGFSTTSTDIGYDSRLTITGSPTITNLKSVRLAFNSLANATLPAGLRWSSVKSFYRGSAVSAEGSAGAGFSNASGYS